MRNTKNTRRGFTQKCSVLHLMEKVAGVRNALFTSPLEGEGGRRPGEGGIETTFIDYFFHVIILLLSHSG